LPKPSVCGDLQNRKKKKRRANKSFPGKRRSPTGFQCVGPKKKKSPQPLGQGRAGAVQQNRPSNDKKKKKNRCFITRRGSRLLGLKHANGSGGGETEGSESVHRKLQAKTKDDGNTLGIEHLGERWTERSSGLFNQRTSGKTGGRLSIRNDPIEGNMFLREK